MPQVGKQSALRLSLEDELNGAAELDGHAGQHLGGGFPSMGEREDRRFEVVQCTMQEMQKNATGGSGLKLFQGEALLRLRDGFVNLARPIGGETETLRDGARFARDSRPLSSLGMEMCQGSPLLAPLFWEQSLWAAQGRASQAVCLGGLRDSQFKIISLTGIKFITPFSSPEGQLL